MLMRHSLPCKTSLSKAIKGSRRARAMQGKTQLEACLVNIPNQEERAEPQRYAMDITRKECPAIHATTE
jgi:hypothetical protein